MQAADWDCGIACILTVLRRLCPAALFQREALCKRVGTTSVWTIDLVHLLMALGEDQDGQSDGGACGVKCMHYTTFEPATMDDLDVDRSRVLQLVQKVADAGRIDKRRLTLEEMEHMLTQEQLLIVLVDAKVLHRDAVRKKTASSVLDPLWRALSPPTVDSFVGHFIVLLAFDKASNSFTVFDPAFAKPSIVPRSTIEEARSVQGTDDDVIAVFT